jgi:uncharacterized protein YpuA (DUF1002 family)
LIFDNFCASSVYYFNIFFTDPEAATPASQALSREEKDDIDEFSSDTNTNIYSIQTSRVKVYFSKVTRYQEATIKFYSTAKIYKKALIQDIVVQTTNETIELAVIYDNNSYSIPFQIANKDIANT